MIREFLSQVLIIVAVALVVVVVEEEKEEEEAVAVATAASHVRSVSSHPSFQDVEVKFLNAFSGVLFGRDRDLKGVEVYQTTVGSCRIWTLGTLETSEWSNA